MQNNIRAVVCDSCSEIALEFDNDQITAEALEGRIHCCDSCSALGRVSFDDENGRVEFLLLTDEQVAQQDTCTLIDAYMKSQKRITELYHEVEKRMIHTSGDREQWWQARYDLVQEEIKRLRELEEERVADVIDEDSPLVVAAQAGLAAATALAESVLSVSYAPTWLKEQARAFLANQPAPPPGKAYYCSKCGFVPRSSRECEEWQCDQCGGCMTGQPAAPTNDQRPECYGFEPEPPALTLCVPGDICQRPARCLGGPCLGRSQPAAPHRPQYPDHRAKVSDLHQHPAPSRTESEPPWTSGTAIDHIPCLQATAAINARTEAEYAVLDAWAQLVEHLPDPEALRADKRISIHCKRLLADIAELARRGLK